VKRLCLQVSDTLLTMLSTFAMQNLLLLVSGVKINGVDEETENFLHLDLFTAVLGMHSVVSAGLTNQVTAAPKVQAQPLLRSHKL
jgi:hypothetical protein